MSDSEKHLVKLSEISNRPDFKEMVEKANAEYDYQTELTELLDKKSDAYSRETILEIVLWKTNRFPTIPSDFVDKINELRADYTEEKMIELLKIMLGDKAKGFDLPMASTVLRFACPNHCQIIDQRVYRLIYSEVKEFKIPRGEEEKIKLYTKYLKDLRKICDETGIKFFEADRVLYKLDKTLNKGIRLKY